MNSAQSFMPLIEKVHDPITVRWPTIMSFQPTTLRLPPTATSAMRPQGAVQRTACCLAMSPPAQSMAQEAPLPRVSFLTSSTGSWVLALMTCAAP